MPANQNSSAGTGDGTARRRTRRRRTAGTRTGAATGLGGDVAVSGSGGNINPTLLTGRERQIWDRAYAVGQRHGCEFMGGTVSQGGRAKL